MVQKIGGSKKSFSTEEIPPIENNGKTYYSNQEKATIFNTFFAAQSKIEENDDEAMADVAWVDSFISNIRLSTDEVKRVLKSLHPRKAVGPRCDRSLGEGRCPSIWNTAHITPIHKKGSNEICNNYRPRIMNLGEQLEGCIQPNEN